MMANKDAFDQYWEWANKPLESTLPCQSRYTIR
jgi:hypothetical protein